MSEVAHTHACGMKRPWKIWVGGNSFNLRIYSSGFGSRKTALASVQRGLDSGEFRNSDGVVRTRFMAQAIYVGTMTELNACLIEDGKLVLGDVPKMRRVS